MQSWKVPSVPCSFSVQEVYGYTSRKEMQVVPVLTAPHSAFVPYVSWSGRPLRSPCVLSAPHSVFVLHRQNKLVRVFSRGEPARRVYPILLTGLREPRKKVRQLYVYLFRIYE